MSLGPRARLAMVRLTCIAGVWGAHAGWGIRPHGAWPLAVCPRWVYTATWSLPLWVLLSTSFPIFGVVGEVRTWVRGHGCDVLGVGQVHGCSGIMVTCTGCVVVMTGVVTCPWWPECMACSGGLGYEAGVYEAQRGLPAI